MQYTYLLTTQLESQRQYFEEKILEATKDANLRVNISFWKKAYPVLCFPPFLSSVKVTDYNYFFMFKNMNRVKVSSALFFVFCLRVCVCEKERECACVWILCSCMCVLILIYGAPVIAGGSHICLYLLFFSGDRTAGTAGVSVWW